MLVNIVSLLALLTIILVVCANHVSVNIGRVSKHKTLVSYLKFFGVFSAMILFPATAVIVLFGSNFDPLVIFGRIALGFTFALVVGVVINGFDEPFLKATEKYVAWLR